MRFVTVSMMVLSLAGCAGWGSLHDGHLLNEETVMRAKAASLLAPPTYEQRQTFGVLAELAGHTYRGEANGEGALPQAEIQEWSWTDGGKALLIRNAVEDGSHGGETVVRPGGDGEALRYTYRSNSGVSTAGMMTVGKGGTWEAVQETTTQNSAPKMRSLGQLRDDGTLTGVAETYKDGAWVPGFSYVYHETDDALPDLKPAIGP